MCPLHRGFFLFRVSFIRGSSVYAYMYNIHATPYNAYISRVFNFANFANLESFAKFIQLKF